MINCTELQIKRNYRTFTQAYRKRKKLFRLSVNIGLEREPIADSLKSRRLSADTDTEGHFGRSLAMILQWHIAVINPP